MAPRAKKQADGALCQALVSYGEYHAHPANQLIHLVCVPALLFTLLVALAYAPAPPLSLPLPLALSSYFSFWPLTVTLAYCAYYTCALDAFAGACWSALVGLPLCAGACHFFAALGPAAAWRWAAITHALSWALQIGPGHAYFERRRPALVDSFWQAIATAPLFVFVEVLFALGWNGALRERVGKGVAAGLKKEQQRRQEQQQETTRTTPTRRRAAARA